MKLKTINQRSTKKKLGKQIKTLDSEVTMIVDESKTKPNNKECSESKKKLICGL